MNERIQKLMPECWVWPLDKQLYTKKQMEEFAESIVKECARLVETRDPRNEPIAHIYLLKAFGVEP